LGEFIIILVLCLVLFVQEQRKAKKHKQNYQHTQFVNGIWVGLDAVEQLGLAGAILVLPSLPLSLVLSAQYSPLLSH